MGKRKSLHTDPTSTGEPVLWATPSKGTTAKRSRLANEFKQLFSSSETEKPARKRGRPKKVDRQTTDSKSASKKTVDQMPSVKKPADKPARAAVVTRSIKAGENKKPVKVTKTKAKESQSTAKKRKPSMAEIDEQESSEEEDTPSLFEKSDKEKTADNIELVFDESDDDASEQDHLEENQFAQHQERNQSGRARELAFGKSANDTDKDRVKQEESGSEKELVEEKEDVKVPARAEQDVIKAKMAFDRMNQDNQCKQLAQEQHDGMTLFLLSLKPSLDLLKADHLFLEETKIGIMKLILDRSKSLLGNSVARS